MAGFFALNWIYTIQKYMLNAIVKLELHDDGKTVTATFKTGGQQQMKIKDIMKVKHEKTLVESYLEPYLFPITYKAGGSSKTYYIHG